MYYSFRAWLPAANQVLSMTSYISCSHLLTFTSPFQASLSYHLHINGCMLCAAEVLSRWLRPSLSWQSVTYVYCQFPVWQRQQYISTDRERRANPDDLIFRAIGLYFTKPRIRELSISMIDNAIIILISLDSCANLRICSREISEN